MKLFFKGLLWALVMSIFLLSCIDPVTPNFQYTEGLIYVEGFASTSPGTSYVILSRSSSEFGLYRNIFEEGAQVSFINSLTNEIVYLEEYKDVYRPPDDFSVLVGESWKMRAVLKDGTEVESESEIVEAPVEIIDISTVYTPELKYSDAFGKFVPGHSIFVSFSDPPDRENYYYWRFTSFEDLPICQYCPFGKFREGICLTDSEEYSYSCETACWRIRFNDEIKLFADNFTNGLHIENLPVANVLLYSNEDILVRVEQFSLSPEAYRYYRTLKDLVDDNGGLNAPPPAAFVGNMYVTDDNDAFVLGRFTAASSSIFNVYIERADITHEVLEDAPPFKFESGLGEVVVTAPCIESRYRTSIPPVGWKD